MLDKRKVIENEIASLEQKLDELQSDEYRRHSDMINQRSLELASSSSFADSSIARSEDSSNHEILQENVDIIVVPMAHHQVLNNNNNGCIECNAPSNHLCRKCNKCVCSLCCGEKRALENAWWCDACFKTQTVATQQLIRNGDYFSDDGE